MTEAEARVLTAARAYRDRKTGTGNARANDLLCAALALDDPKLGVEPEWVTILPTVEGWYWVRWNGGEPYIMSLWYENGKSCHAPVTSLPPRDWNPGSGLEWWPVPIVPPGVGQ